MRLKSVTLKGFKSFPDRTTLEFGPGVSVVVGPNGSGKSNVTDAVLWAMGEQSPLAVRGQSMQDVIFGGGRGVQPRSQAEVEIVLDNSDGAVAVPFGEISIARRLDRNGEGGYRLNGARCRLTDVIEVLSDTGLGKETHSVISQGRVDSIVTSRPRDRRLLIEEAAGLGKHRKRRRRAQLKLDRTQENLDRALDIEREARTRLRPLKRQSEAAQLHERLERQILQARLELAEDTSLTARGELDGAEAAAAATRAARAEVEARLAETVTRRGAAERALAERAERHDALAGRAFRARAAGERLSLRGEQTAAAERVLAGRIERIAAELAALVPAPAEDGEPPAGERGRIEALAAELAEIEAGREQELARELEGLSAEAEGHEARASECEAQLQLAVAAREAGDRDAASARERAAAAERDAQRAREASGRVGAELAAANQFLRVHAAAGGEDGARTRSLSGELSVREGFELALAAALGGRLDAALVGDVTGAHALLDRAGPDGAAALLAGEAPAGASAAQARQGPAPAPGALRLLDLVTGPEPALGAAGRLLADAWVVEDLGELRDGFTGIAVTRGGRVWFAAWGEIRQVAGGGSERVLAARNERERLVGQAERAAQAVLDAERGCADAAAAVDAAEAARALAEDAQRESERRRSEAAEELRRSRWLIEQRRSAPAEGALAVRRAEIEGELAAERRQAERREGERAAREAREQRLRAQHAADTALAPSARRLSEALASAAQAVGERAAALEHELQQDRQAGERMAGELREHAAEESRIQADLRAAGEDVTEAEVAAQRTRDRSAEAELERRTLAERLGIEAAPSATAPPAAGARLSEGEIESLRERVRRLERRREQLGPVNPLAQEEYAQAVEHVEELETRREDLETSLRELRGVIREADRQIEETFAATFAAAARNFGELVGDVFPGGSGRLLLVADEQTPRPVLGGQPLADGGDGAAEDAAEAEAEAELRGAEERELPGVEIEITPAGKATKRLSLLSGGEKSMTALAFLFAVFLARPCPFYILDEVEAALDDVNLERFLALLRRYADRAQFIVITHQKRTMDAADTLYGVSMGTDGVSKVLSRRLPADGDAAAIGVGVAEVA